MNSMKTLIFIAISLWGNNVFAKTKAITDKGEEVILYDNGTWKSTEIKQGYDTRLDTLVVNRKSSAGFLVKSTRNTSGVFIDPKQWSLMKKAPDASSQQEYSFNLKEGDAYAMMITEQIEMPLNSLAEIALENMKEVAPDGRISRDEIRKVNGAIVKCLQMEGSVKGIEFIFLGYYFTAENCTTQLVSYTSKSLFPKYKKDMEDLINGFTFIKN